MSELEETVSLPTNKVGRVLYNISRILAILGGIMLCAMSIMTTISVIGRALNIGPIPGDFELVAIGTGLAVFAFLPYCQLMQGNVIVDFFMDRASVRTKHIADMVGAALYLSVAFILTWRMYFGGFDMYDNNEVSMTIGFPRWTTFPFSFLCMCILLIVIVYTIGRSLAKIWAGRFFHND